MTVQPRGKVLVTPRSVSAGGHPSLDKLRSAGFEVLFPTPGKQPSEADLMRSLPGCVGYLAGVEPVPASVLEAAKGLKVISRNGVGVDNVDLAAAKRLGITVCKAAGANSRGVAELAMRTSSRWPGGCRSAIAGSRPGGGTAARASS